VLLLEQLSFVSGRKRKTHFRLVSNRHSTSQPLPRRIKNSKHYKVDYSSVYLTKFDWLLRFTV